MSKSKVDGFEAAPDGVWVTEATNVLIASFGSFFGTVSGDLGVRARGVFHLGALFLNPVGQLVKNFLCERELLATEESCHLLIDEVYGVIETAFIFDVVARAK